MFGGKPSTRCSRRNNLRRILAVGHRQDTLPHQHLDRIKTGHSSPRATHLSSDSPSSLSFELGLLSGCNVTSSQPWFPVLYLFEAGLADCSVAHGLSSGTSK